MPLWSAAILFFIFELQGKKPLPGRAIPHPGNGFLEALYGEDWLSGLCPAHILF